MPKLNKSSPFRTFKTSSLPPERLPIINRILAVPTALWLCSEASDQNLEVATSASTFAQERFLTFKRILETVKKEIIDKKGDATTRIAKSFQVNQEVVLSEKSFGQQFWSGPGTIVKIKKNKIEVQLGKKKAQYVRDRLRPIDDFRKEGEGYVLKIHETNNIAAVQRQQGSTQQNLAPNSSPKFRPEAFPEDSEQIQEPLINRPKQKTRKLIRSV